MVVLFLLFKLSGMNLVKGVFLYRRIFFFFGLVFWFFWNVGFSSFVIKEFLLSFVILTCGSVSNFCMVSEVYMSLILNMDKVYNIKYNLLLCLCWMFLNF